MASFPSDAQHFTSHLNPSPRPLTVSQGTTPLPLLPHTFFSPKECRHGRAW